MKYFHLDVSACPSKQHFPFQAASDFWEFRNWTGKIRRKRKEEIDGGKNLNGPKYKQPKSQKRETWMVLPYVHFLLSLFFSSILPPTLPLLPPFLSFSIIYCLFFSMIGTVWVGENFWKNLLSIAFYKEVLPSITLFETSCRLNFTDEAQGAHMYFLKVILQELCSFFYVVLV
jgi:hypothetical protein